MEPKANKRRFQHLYSSIVSHSYADTVDQLDSLGLHDFQKRPTLLLILKISGWRYEPGTALAEATSRSAPTYARTIKMNTQMPLYTNEVSAEFLRTLDKSPFTEQQLDAFDDQALTIVNQQQAYKASHPPTAIYRVATEGSQTRNGGVIQHATGPYEFTLDNGQHVRSARKGDEVVYADGSTAHIVTTSGESNSHVALVGGHLSNGDELINTPQEGFLFIAREGVPMPEDFLPVIEG